MVRSGAASLILSLWFAAILPGTQALAQEPPASGAKAPAAETPGDPGRPSAAQGTTARTRLAPQGLHAALVGEGLRWEGPSLPRHQVPKPLAERWRTQPFEAGYVSPYFEPILFVRPLYVTTREDSFIDGTGRARSSRELRRTFLGHREGFVLENVETGFRGRVNDLGLHYGIVIEWVPREKDGTKSESDFLKEVWIGWNRYSVLDIQVGRLKLPASQANLKPTAALPLVYRPLLDTLLPKRMIGASVSLSDPWKVAVLTGGVFNTSKEAHEQLADTRFLMGSGRLVFHVDRILDAAGIATGDFFDLSLGGSYAWAKENYDPRTEMRYLGVDARLKLSIVTLEGELLFKDYYGEGTQAGKACRGTGWHADLVIQAWPSILDLVFRVEEADNNDQIRVDFADTAGLAMDQKKMWLTFGVMLHLARQVDLAINYVNRREREGRSFQNDMFLTMLQVHL